MRIFLRLFIGFIGMVGAFYLDYQMHTWYNDILIFISSVIFGYGFFFGMAELID